MNKKRTWLGWVLGIIIALLILIGFLPMIASSTFGNHFLLKEINRRITGTISTKKMTFHWFGPQVIEELALQDEKNETIASIKHFESHTSLFSLAFKRIGNTTVESPYVFVDKDDQQQVNVEKSLKRKMPKPSANPAHIGGKTCPKFVGEIVVSDGTLILNAPRVKTVTISSIEFDYKPESDLFHVSANTQQEEIQGNILASGNFHNQLHILAEIKNFPVAILDQLGDDKTFYTTAIGETLDCVIETQKKEGSLFLTAEVKSLNLNGTVNGATYLGSFTVEPDSQLTYTLTPQTFYAMVGGEQKKHWALASKSDLSIKIIEGQIPLTNRELDYSDIKLRAEVTMERAEVIHKEAGPYSFNDFQAQILTRDDLEITASVHILGKEDSKITLSTTIDNDDVVAYNLTAEGLPYALLELFFEEANIMHEAFGDFITLRANGTYDHGKSTNHIEVESPITSFAGDIEGSSLKELAFSVTGQRALQENWKTVFGPLVDFSLSGKASIYERSFAVSTLSGKLSNPYFDIDVRGRVGEKGKPFSYDKLQLTANGTLLKLPYQETFPDTTLKKGNFVLDLDGSKNLAVGTAKILVASQTGESTIESKASEIHIEMKDFIYENKLDWANANVSFKASLEYFPVAILDPFLPEGVDLLFLTGPTVNAQTSGTYTPRATDHLAQIDLKANSEGFETQFSVSVDGTLSINQPQPAFVHWVVTPERYRRLIEIVSPGKSTEYTLAQAATLDFEMTELKCPATLPGTLSSFLCQSGIVGNLKISPMLFMNGEQIMTIKEIAGSVKGENFSEKISFDMHGTIVAPNVPASESSGFSFVGDILNLWTHEGKVNRNQLTVNAEANLELIPITQATGILPMKPETRVVMRALLGDLLNARIYGDVTEHTGPITIDVKSSNLKALLPLQLTPEAILLRDYVDAEITLTEQISEDLLIDVNPLLITGATSDHPLKLYIDPEDFSIAINPFTFKGIRVTKAIIDIGKIRVRNGGEIQRLMDFLKAKEISEDKWMDAWFTPIFVSLIEGTASYKRFDLLLAEKVHLAFWGRIDLVKDKVKMTMGIASSTLTQRFNIMGLSKDDMFQVKMRGRSSDVELDWSSAYTRIGIIVARLAGGHIGYLVGGVIEQIVSVFGDEATPPPTTKPFPWESQYPSDPGEVIPTEAAPPTLKQKGVKRFLHFLAP